MTSPPGRKSRLTARRLAEGLERLDPRQLEILKKIEAEEREQLGLFAEAVRS